MVGLCRQDVVDLLYGLYGLFADTIHTVDICVILSGSRLAKHTSSFHSLSLSHQHEQQQQHCWTGHTLLPCLKFWWEVCVGVLDGA